MTRLAIRTPDAAVQIAALQDRVDELEELVGTRLPIPPSLPFHLTPRERQLLGILLKGRLVDKEYAHRAIYGLLPEASWPELKIIDVFICKIRKKLKPLGIAISTAWGQGYYFDPANLAEIKKIFGGAA